MQRDYNVTFDQSEDLLLFYEAVTYLQSKQNTPHSSTTAHTVTLPQVTCRSVLVYDDKAAVRRQP
jgi:hypothetical protein